MHTFNFGKSNRLLVGQLPVFNYNMNWFIRCAY